VGLAKSTINEGCYGSVISGSISVSFWQKKPWYPFFTVLVFPYKKCLSHYTYGLLKTIKPITLRRTIHQVDNIVMFVD